MLASTQAAKNYKDRRIFHSPLLVPQVHEESTGRAHLGRLRDAFRGDGQGRPNRRELKRPDRETLRQSGVRDLLRVTSRSVRPMALASPEMDGAPRVDCADICALLFCSPEKGRDSCNLVCSFIAVEARISFFGQFVFFCLSRIPESLPNRPRSRET